MGGKNSEATSQTQSRAPVPAEDDFFSKDSVITALALVIGSCILMVSYQIRLMAIRDFGTVIHEFDPYFNLRATEVSNLRLYSSTSDICEGRNTFCMQSFYVIY